MQSPRVHPGDLLGSAILTGPLVSAPLPIGGLLVVPDAIAPVVPHKLRLVLRAECSGVCFGSAIVMAFPWLSESS